MIMRILSVLWSTGLVLLSAFLWYFLYKDRNEITFDKDYLVYKYIMFIGNTFLSIGSLMNLYVGLVELIR